jgi:hypothetical protein
MAAPRSLTRCDRFIQNQNEDITISTTRMRILLSSCPWSMMVVVVVWLLLLVVVAVGVCSIL